jgi:predicted DNA-binding transcriptional regulator YafY
LIKSGWRPIQEGASWEEILFPKTVDVLKGKISGGNSGPVKVSTDSSSDSMEDEEDEDTHKLHKLSQAVQKGQKIAVEIRGDYTWEGRLHEVIFRREFKTAAP